MKTGFKEALEKVVRAKESSDQYCQVTIGHDWSIDVYVNPDESKLRQAIASFTGLIGTLKKKQEDYGTAFEYTGSNDIINVRIKTPEQCKIVGYIVEKRPKRVVIESSEMEEIRKPVTDCDLKQGKVQAGQFLPVELEEFPEEVIV